MSLSHHSTSGYSLQAGLTEFENTGHMYELEKVGPN